MDLIFPDNIFSKFIRASLPEEWKLNVTLQPSAAITAELKKQHGSIGLIPTMDLLKNNDLFISASAGLSFEGMLCNSFLYFKPEQDEIQDLSLFGDVSTLEVILSKILFKELYDSNLEIRILSDKSKIGSTNLLIVGDENYNNDKFLNGLSLAEEVTEALNLPYVNYVFASTDEKMLAEFNTGIKDITGAIYRKIEEDNFPISISEKAKHFFDDNISSMIFEFNEQDREGINNLIRLPYFYRIIEDMIELKFV